MKRLLILAAVLLCCASSAFAQAGSIGIFGDPAGTDCHLVDAGSLVQVYFLHVLTPGAKASQFRLDLRGLPWIHLGDMWNFPTVIGVSISGVAIAYGFCHASPISLGMANFFGAFVPSCSRVGIGPDPGSYFGLIEGVDCSIPANRTFPTGGEAIVNPDGSCFCNVPASESSWGRVKSLYTAD